MPITFIPGSGDVLMCEFGPDPLDQGTYPLAAGPCSVAPEMIKRRHVVVLATRGLMVTVAPFSTVAPNHVQNFHHLIPDGSYPFFAAGEDNWLKGDMITAVSRDRLDRVFHGGRYQRAPLAPADFRAARRCILHGIGLGTLAQHV